MIKKVLFRNGKKYYWSSGDLHTDAGVLKEEDLLKDVTEVVSKSDKKFQVVNANFLDKLEKIKRGPQAMMLKDIYSIIAYTGVDSNSKVLDCGVGCGVMSACLSRFVKEVIAYEWKEENLQLANKNFESLNVNVKVKHKDIYKGVDEKDLDLVMLDLPEPWNVNAFNSLKYGGYLVAYLPSITQVQEFVKIVKSKYMVVKVIENIEREWIVDGLKVRPKSPGILHTAFLVFCRKV